jgi:hypothetical protein
MHFCSQPYCEREDTGLGLCAQHQSPVGRQSRVIPHGTGSGTRGHSSHAERRGLEPRKPGNHDSTSEDAEAPAAAATSERFSTAIPDEGVRN